MSWSTDSIEMHAITLEWDIEYYYSYYRSVLEHQIEGIPPEDYDQELFDAELRYLTAKQAYYEYITKHAEYFI